MSDKTSVKLDPSWLDVIGVEFDKSYMVQLKSFLAQEKKAGKVIYPKGDEIFNAMNTTRFDDVRVVILGQDPYHGAGQAHGLSFSVRSGVKLPPSLMNIYKEISAEYDVLMPKDGDLTRWAKQGVLLLNATLTVQDSLAGSHQNKGWEEFTDAIVRAINDRAENIVFLLWGSYAQKKGAIIDRKKHLVLTASHPSPLSAHRGFLGCGHFRAANDYLESNGFSPIDWV
ncbi:MAG: uracil-DNA glycosylase [Alphaproteobacteria bacterium]|nr:uracil-DNA glycosylase [Alphaproteobacteria bacterium]MCB9985050.1 uracil-DNA glycosylase [Micavibrio sp.]HRK97432.1 uracil-DNA glycosylase [Alphaproteobacteria bacterium]